MTIILGPTLYFFISYPALKIHLLKLAEELGCPVLDGYAQQHFDPQGFALIDDKASSSLLHRLAEHLPLIVFSDTLVTPLALHHVSPTIKVHSFKELITPKVSIQHKEQLHDVLVGQSVCWQSLLELIELAARKECTVLIQGESGTGKELVARTIHQLSSHSQSPFVPLNCGAIPIELVESELFGHEKGAFTGAVTSRLGKFELVQKGTLFLDEIGDMPLAMQVKILRVLQERQFERIGSNKLIRFEGRLISASHQILTTLVQQKLFREDLFYRLNVLPIYLPPLRERLDDIPMIIQSSVERKLVNISISNQGIEVLMNYYWPGNVRQLINLLQRAEVFYGQQTLEEHHVHELLKFEPHMPLREKISYPSPSQG